MLRLCFALAALCAFAQPAHAQNLPRRVTIGVAGAANPEGGVVVQSVRPDGAGAAAGLAPGDIITRIGAREIATTQDLSLLSARLRRDARRRSPSPAPAQRRRCT